MKNSHCLCLCLRACVAHTSQSDRLHEGLLRLALVVLQLGGGSVGLEAGDNTGWESDCRRSCAHQFVTGEMFNKIRTNLHHITL